MTAVFVSGIVLRPQRRHLGLGLDSWVALVIYGSSSVSVGRFMPALAAVGTVRPR
jgi:hypothetical protein